VILNNQINKTYYLLLNYWFILGNPTEAN